MVAREFVDERFGHGLDISNDASKAHSANFGAINDYWHHLRNSSEFAKSWNMWDSPTASYANLMFATLSAIAMFAQGWGILIGATWSRVRI
jgi:hypothetical protein